MACFTPLKMTFCIASNAKEREHNDARMSSATVLLQLLCDTELLEMQVVLYRYSTLQLLLLRRMREAQKVMSTCADLAKTASIAEHSGNAVLSEWRSAVPDSHLMAKLL